PRPAVPTCWPTPSPVIRAWVPSSARTTAGCRLGSSGSRSPPAPPARSSSTMAPAAPSSSGARRCCPPACGSCRGRSTRATRSTLPTPRASCSPGGWWPSTLRPCATSLGDGRPSSRPTCGTKRSTATTWWCCRGERGGSVGSRRLHGGGITRGQAQLGAHLIETAPRLGVEGGLLDLEHAVLDGLALELGEALGFGVAGLDLGADLVE